MRKKTDQCDKEYTYKKTNQFLTKRFYRNKMLRKENLLEKYTYFNYKLHTMRFYEGITEPWEIKEIIQNDIKKWIESMKSLITQLNMDLSDA